MKDIASYPPDWSTIAFEVKRQAKFVCQCCHQSTIDDPSLTLNVHHLDFNPANNHPDNLICLCQICHVRLHGILHASYQRLKNYYIAVSRGQIPLELPDEFMPVSLEKAITFIQENFLSRTTE